jgi:hypothetical protein
MCGAISGVQYIAGNNAENQGCRNREQQCRANCNADMWHRG